jgi:hypothetical protein
MMMPSAKTGFGVSRDAMKIKINRWSLILFILSSQVDYVG